MKSNSSTQMSRKNRERERHRREILSAAERLFARKGYRSTTIQEIAMEAEFATGTLYIHFRNKYELYLRVIEEWSREFMEQFEHQVRPVEDAEQAIAALIELRLRYSYRHRGFIHTAQEDTPALRMDPLSDAPGPLVAIYDRYVQALSEFFQKGISKGVFLKVDPHYLAFCLEGTINAFVAHWSRHEPHRSFGTLVESIIHPFLEQIKPRCFVDHHDALRSAQKPRPGRFQTAEYKNENV